MTVVNRDDATHPTPDASAWDQTAYINRELGWLRFNRRVLDLALDDRQPLLERIKFLSIFASNLDEFFMIRVSGLRRQLQTGVRTAPPDGMTPAEQLSAVREQLVPVLESCFECWQTDLLPGLGDAGIHILGYSDLKRKQRKLLRRHFKKQIFPALTPLAFDPSHPFPHISNLSLNLAVVIGDPGDGEKFARVKVPLIFPRLIRIPDEEKVAPEEVLGLEGDGAGNFVWLEEVVAANLDLLFPGLDIVAAYPFRVTRDADFEIEEDEASDLLTAMVEVVGQRHFGSAVRLEVDEQMPVRIREILERNLEVVPFQVFTSPGPIGLAGLGQLVELKMPELKDPPFLPAVGSALAGEESLFSVMSRRDVLLYHPYDSFTPVVDFVREAAQDPDVLAIKQTLYRVGPNSPVVEALMEARENGKQVSVLVELKARFDEEYNIGWARALEAAGVHVVYGLMGLKTHAKMCLVVRRESGGIRPYVHLSTGNYNPMTARVYTDIGYLTCDADIAKDVADLFNALTGYSKKEEYRRLLVSPHSMRQGLLDRIDREIEVHEREGGGHLVFKMNALVDKACIDALYHASQAGVQIDLQVRGICCLRPGLPGVSESIRVTSIVGRFLEHSRIYYFRNGGDEEILIGSADLMPRNLDGRVEVLFPLLDERQRRDVCDILFLHLADNVGVRELDSEGEYGSIDVDDEAAPMSSQEWLLEQGGAWRPEE